MDQATPEADRLLTPDDLSAYLQRPNPTLYAWRHRGEGPPAMRVGRDLRWRRSEVDAWLEGQKGVSIASGVA